MGRMKVKTYQQNGLWFVEIVKDHCYDLKPGAQLETGEFGVFTNFSSPESCGFNSRRAAREALKSYTNVRRRFITVTGGLH